MSNIVVSQMKALAGRVLPGNDPEAASELLATLKQTAFKGNVTDSQMSALLIVANQYGLNPWTKEIYAFPDKKNGIIPVVGVDGWSRIINSHPEFDGMDFNSSEEIVTMEGAKPCPSWIECVIYRKDRSRPIVVREYLDEVYRAAFKGEYGTVVGPWQTHTKRFLRHKAMIQAGRIGFGFTGIFDQDEAERIVDMGAVTPVRQNSPASAAAAGESEEFSQYVELHSPGLDDAANLGTESLLAAFKKIPKSPMKERMWEKIGAELKEKAQGADAKNAPIEGVFEEVSDDSSS